MGFRFRKSFRIVPGIRLNLNSKSTSVRIGPKGLGYTVSSTGKRRVTASIPGTSLSHSEVIGSAAARRPGTSQSKRGIWAVVLPIVVLVIGAVTFGSGRPTNSEVGTSNTHAILAAPAHETAATEKRVVTASSLNVRSAPTTASDVMAKLTGGQRLTVLERNGGWLLIQSNEVKGWVSEQFTSAVLPAATEAKEIPSPQQMEVQRVQFAKCGRVRQNCVVDGDTIWLNGQNLRLQSFDTPEPYEGICGGAKEIALAGQASARLVQLLNGSDFTVETAGQDRYGRTLATIRINGTDVGDILISERLARRWPDGDEWWCRP